MPKHNKKTRLKTKLPFLAKIIAVLLLSFPVMLLGMVFTSLYLHFFGGYPIPQDVAWARDLVFLFIISIAIIFIAVQLFRRKNYARILAIIAFFIISILNLRAEIFIADSPSISSLFFNILFFLSALYLIFSKKVRRAFS